MRKSGTESEPLTRSAFLILRRHLSHAVSEWEDSDELATAFADRVLREVFAHECFNQANIEINQSGAKDLAISSNLEKTLNR